MKLNFSNYRAGKDSNQWLNELAKEFLNEHDIVSNTKIRTWLRSRKGSKCFIDWLESRGWQVSYWELLPMVDEDGKKTYIAYGINIKDDCPKFVEYVLRNSD